MTEEEDDKTEEEEELESLAVAKSKSENKSSVLQSEIPLPTSNPGKTTNKERVCVFNHRSCAPQSVVSLVEQAMLPSFLLSCNL